MFGLSRKKKVDMTAPAGPRIPSERVVSLSSQGLSEPEIIKTLREEGFSPLDVDRAMKEALRTGTGVQTPGAPPAAPAQPPAPVAAPAPAPFLPAQPPAPSNLVPAAGPPNQPPALPQFPQSKYAPTVWETGDEMEEDTMNLPRERRIGPDRFLTEMEEGPPMPGPEREPLPFAEPPLPKGRPERGREVKERRRREVEELTEEITEEKWSDMMNRINNLEGMVEKMATSVKSAATQVSSPGAPAPELDAIRNEMETQKHGIEETNARIDSLEEVVKGSLTPMVESIRKFSHAVKTAKQPVSPQPAESGQEPVPTAAPPTPEPPEPKPSEKKEE